MQVAGPPDQHQQRENHTGGDAGQHAQGQLAGEHHQREHQLGPAAGQQLAEIAQVGKMQHRRDDDGRQRAVRQAAKQRRQRDQGDEAEDGGDEVGKLGAGSCGDRDGGLRQAADDEEAAEQAAQDVGGAMCDQLLVRVDLTAIPHCRSLGTAERLGIADQHDGERTRDELAEQARIDPRPAEVGQAGRQCPDHADPRCLAADQADEQGRGDRDDQGRGDRGRQAAQCHHRGEAQKAGEHRRRRRAREMLQQRPQLLEEVARSAGDAQQVRHLSDDGDPDQAFDESPHHRRRDEGRDPAHPQRAEQQEEDSDEDGERGGQRVEVGGALRRDGAHRQRRDQPGGGVGSDHQQARCAEQGIGDERRDDGVEAHDRRDADDAGIGHALGDHDRPDREAGQQIRHCPIPAIGRQPAEDGQQALG